MVVLMFALSLTNVFFAFFLLSGHSLFVFTDPYKEYSEDDDESDEESGNVGLEGAEIERRGGFLGRTGCAFIKIDTVQYKKIY